MRRTALGLVLFALAACNDGSGPAPGAVVEEAWVVAGPHNVLSAVVWVAGTGDSVRVAFRAAGETADSTTPWFPFDAASDSTRAIVLGLRPGAAYAFRAVVRGGADSAVSDSLALTTGALPADLPRYTAGGPDPLPGYVVFGAGAYAIAIDNSGRVAWYRRFPTGGPGLNVMTQPRGVYIGRVSLPDTTQEYFLLLDPLGDSVGTVTCGNGRQMRFHDAIMQADGTTWMLCDDSRTMDLTALGGQPSALVTATTVQHVAADGSVLWEWNAFDHFALTDLDSASRAGANVNFTHGNSLDLDPDGNLLVAFRSLNELTRISAQTGAVLWRMGGPMNQFSFTGPAETGFSRMHNVRVTGPGSFVILDNVGGTASRFERYSWSVNGMTTGLDQSYVSSPAVLTLIGGSVQRAGPGRWLVSFGTQGRVEEFDDAGIRHWQIIGNAGYVFRAQRIRSLYSPGVGDGR